MSLLTTSTVREEHAYTRSKTPWLLDSEREAREATGGNAKFGWQLFHYLSGGGLKAFGRSVAQEEAEAKRDAFLRRAAVLAAVWLYFWW